MRRFFGALADILGRPGPFLTCYLPIGDAREVAASRLAVAEADLSEVERTFCETLLTDFPAEFDASGPDSSGPDSSVADAALTDDTAAMVVGVLAGDGVGFSQTYPEGPTSPFIERGHVPRITPLIDAEQRLRHHLLVVVSEDGIDVMTFPRHGAPSMHRASETDRDRQAHLVVESVKATGTRFVLLAGSPAEVDELETLVRGAVPIETIVETVGAADLGADAAAWLADRAVVEVATDRARATVETLRTWRFERAHDLGLSDVVDVVQALRSGTARLLLVADDLDDQRQVWIGSDAKDIAIDLEDAQQLEDRAVEFRPVRLVDGLTRSALLQGVPVQIVPAVPDSSLPGGIGAVIDPVPANAT